jgi:predicted  nucleic acid-binding Zn-ribbon protein
MQSLNVGPRAVLLLLWLALPLFCACRAPQIEFASGQCQLNGQTITAHEVERRQATLTERIAARQPVFVVVTILIVVLAGASHIEKLVLLFSTRGVETRGLGERIRVALDRYRVYPVRYFSIVALTLALLVMAGSLYVYLEADKRASERTLGLLQFCHLALREAEAKSVLDEQRRNLDALQSTAGSIRALVDKLPPEEQRKARDMVGHIDTAISKQARFVGDYLEKSGQSMKTLEDRTAALERELVTVQAAVGALKGVPADLHDAAAALKQVDGKLAAFDGKVAAIDGKLVALDGKLEVSAATQKSILSRLDKWVAAPSVAAPPAKDAHVAVPPAKDAHATPAKEELPNPY